MGLNELKAERWRQKYFFFIFLPQYFSLNSWEEFRSLAAGSQRPQQLHRPYQGRRSVIAQAEKPARAGDRIGYNMGKGVPPDAHLKPLAFLINCGHSPETTPNE